MTVDVVGALSFVCSFGGLIVRNIATFLSQESQLAKDVRENLEFIRDEVDSATALLKDMSDSEDNRSCSLEQWLKQINDLINKVYVVLDDYEYRTASGEDKRRVNSHVAPNLKDLRSKAEEVAERRRRYLSDLGTKGSKPKSGVASSSYSEEAHSVEKDKLVETEEQRDLINWVKNDATPQLGVISIVGSGGMGKKTLAMQCFQSLTVVCHARIRVSRDFDLRELLNDLIKQFFGVAPEATTETMKDEVLVEKIRNQLKDKKYVVLLEDVWTTDALKTLISVFPDDGNGSRIIVTTRINSVAKARFHSFRRYVHRIQPLSLERSEELFCKIASFSCPPNLEELMVGILKKCDGIPLAIVTIANILVEDIFNKEHWEMVCNRVGHKWENETRKMKETIMLSYKDLPDDVKLCFLYLSTLPEGAEFKRSYIVSRWIAEGLVSGGNDEQIAKSNFYELVNRNLIDPASIRCGKVKLWKINNMMLDIIATKAIDGNFACIISHNFKSRTLEGSKIRRISVHEAVDSLNSLNLVLARSFRLSFASKNAGKNLWKPDFKEMKLLRMLDLEGCSFIKHQDIRNICNTSLLLKNLCLKDTAISKLPQSIMKLQDLEVLDIRGTDVELPQSFIKLQRLSHLYTSSVTLPEGLTSMESLRVLKTNAAVGSFKIIGQLKQLRKLNIKTGRLTAVLDGEVHEALKNLGNSLTSLTISFLSFGFEDTGTYELPCPKLETLKFGCMSQYSISRVSPSSEHLTKMSLWHYHFHESGIRCLGSQDNLHDLRIHIYHNCDHTKEISIGSGEFKNLRKLSLHVDVPYMKVVFQPGALPNLEFLDLKWGDDHEVNLCQTVLGIENLAKLEEITWEKKKSLKSLRNIKDNRYYPKTRVGRDQYPLNDLIHKMERGHDPIKEVQALDGLHRAVEDLAANESKLTILKSLTSYTCTREYIHVIWKAFLIRGN